MGLFSAAEDTRTHRAEVATLSTSGLHTEDSESWREVALHKTPLLDLVPYLQQLDVSN